MKKLEYENVKSRLMEVDEVLQAAKYKKGEAIVTDGRNKLRAAYLDLEDADETCLKTRLNLEKSIETAKDVGCKEERYQEAKDFLATL